MTKTCITHANCPDGFASYYIAERTFSGGFDFHHAASYETDPPWGMIDDCDVLIADFCYPTARLNEIASRARSLVVLDHHQTSEQFLTDSTLMRCDDVGALAEVMTTGVAAAPAFAYVHDQEQSGAGLTIRLAYALGFQNLRLRWLAESVEDRDLWRFQLKNTREVFAALTSWPYTVEAWDEALQSDMASEGRGIERYRQQLVEMITHPDNVYYLNLGMAPSAPGIGGQKLWVPTVDSPYALSSDCAGALAERFEEYGGDGLAAYTIRRSADVSVGLRSTPNGPDVAEIAERFGGGGHFHASGLRLSWDEYLGRVSDGTPF